MSVRPQRGAPSTTGHVDQMMIALFTDYTHQGPYMGQVIARLASDAPSVRTFTLMADAPMFAPQAAGILLDHCLRDIPPETVVLAVVDPGVGTDRWPILIRSGPFWLVGPNNGLFEPTLRRLGVIEARQITFEPLTRAATFHGRDLFAPAAARLARGAIPASEPIQEAQVRWPDLAVPYPGVIYIDGFGNVITGIDAALADQTNPVTLPGHTIPWATTFGDVTPGSPLVYTNSLGLVEFAVNQGRADRLLGLTAGSLLPTGAIKCL